MPNPSSAPFCTCDNFKCTLNPTNHDQGCNLCIKRNLRKQLIPRCFFLKVTNDVNDDTDFSFESFAKYVLEKNNTIGQE